MRTGTWLALALVVAALAGSAAVGRQLAANGPSAFAVTDSPDAEILRLQALGDDQAAFRAHALRLQHLGNLGGRIVPYKAIAYSKVAAWFRTLDRLNARADVVPSTAALLYGNTQTPGDLRPIIAYLAEHARRAPERKWRWMTHAIYLAGHRLGDDQLALELARELRGFNAAAIPGWARHMDVIALARTGRERAARALVTRLLRDAEDLPLAERRWLKFYLKRELK